VTCLEPPRRTIAFAPPDRSIPILDIYSTMADANPELQAKLQELDHELEEGDITKKGCVCCGAYCASATAVARSTVARL
jgi:cell division septum initiation protein DivIVA